MMNDKELEQFKQKALKRYEEELNKILRGWDQKTPTIIKHEMNLTPKGLIATGYEHIHGITWEEHRKEVNERKKWVEKERKRWEKEVESG